MARSGIMYAQVADAATRLAAAGKNPTVDGIREALGGTGSKSTIAPLLKRWKTAHQETAAQAGLGLPVELVQAVKGVYEGVQTAAALLREQQQHAHEAEIRAQQEQLESAQAEYAVLREEHQAQARSLEAATVQIQQLEAAQHRQEVTLAALRSANTGLEQRLGDRTAEAAALTRQLTQAQAQFEHYQQAVAGQRAEERAAAERRWTRLEQESAEARQRALAQQTLLGEAQGQVQHLAASNERLQKALQTAQDVLARTRTTHDQLAYQLTELAQRHHALEQRHLAADEALVEHRTTLAAAAKERSLLRERLAQTEGQLATLAQERIFLLQEKAVLTDQLRRRRAADNL